MAVEPLLDRLLVDDGLRGEDAELLAAAEPDQLTLAPVRNSGDERGRVDGWAVTLDEQEAEHRPTVSSRPLRGRTLGRATEIRHRLAGVTGGSSSGAR